MPCANKVAAATVIIPADAIAEPSPLANEGTDKPKSAEVVEIPIS